MIVDLVEDSGEGFAFIRIFGKQQNEIESLVRAVRRLETGEADSFFVEALPGFQTQDRMSLEARASDRDSGVLRADLDKSFLWKQTRDTWNVVEGLISGVVPICSHDEFQWLAGPLARYGLEKSNIGVLLSTSNSGQW